MCITDFHGTLILSKIIDLDYVKEKIKAGLGCGIRLVSSNPTSYKIDFKGSGYCREDVIQDFLDEITPFTISGYILYRMENGMKWRHCFNTNCQEWVEESLEYRRSINGKKEAKAETATEAVDEKAEAEAVPANMKTLTEMGCSFNYPNEMEDMKDFDGNVIFTRSF